MNDTDKLLRHNQYALIASQAVKIRELEDENQKLRDHNTKLIQREEARMKAASTVLKVKAEA